MFGYVGLFVPELKVREHMTFKACYCGLCKTLGTHCSQLSRLLLNYDCAFLYVLKAACSGRQGELTFERCVVSPHKKKPIMRSEDAEYAAAVNVLLGRDKLRDDAADSHNPLSSIGAAVYAGAYRRAAERYPEAADAIRQGLGRLGDIERAERASIDEPADAFAEMLGRIFAGAGEAGDDLYRLGYNIGRWIYVIDACDDLRSDAKTGSYNPVLLCFGEEGAGQAEFSLNASIAGAIQAYERLEVRQYKPILDNVLYLGLYEKTRKVLKKCGVTTYGDWPEEPAPEYWEGQEGGV